MPRTREFDPADALDKAMRVFWRKGYTGTSVEDLVKATGVKRSGLYGEFESKRVLYLAALEHYQNIVTFRAIAPLERTGAGLVEIRAFFRMMLEVSCTDAGRLGCLMANTSSEVAPFDKLASRSVHAFRTRLQQAFRGPLLNARSRGELPSNFDVDRAADFLLAVMHSISLLARSNASREMLTNVVESTLDTLK